MSRALFPLELIWRTVNDLRRRGYEKGWFTQHSLPRPVISVGNISTGGSGKTPTVIHLAKFLVARGWRVAILSRGYRRQGSEISLVSENDATRYGDEPVLIRRHVPECDVVVGPSRYESGLWLLNRKDCDVFLFDDGFQHLQLRRDIDLVIDDPEAIHLRESRRALRTAELLLVRTSSAYTESDGREFGLAIEPTTVILGGERHGLGIFVGKRIAAFSGLANNERFFRSLERLGGRVVVRREFRDHADYDESTLQEMMELKEESGADFLVTTEKDWVKFDSFDVGVLTVEAVVSPLADFHGVLIDLLEDSCRKQGRLIPAFEMNHVRS
ncbi:MAG: tetraacyldisaccharide 4'-kinase [Thermoanaerobaculia bacterium]|nr:tetraacyldisaccharide 4'-kinase [Thermoanaerobaculia bacterium]